jgi:ATP-dependent Clp protease adapter protein ClpS
MPVISERLQQLLDRALSLAKQGDYEYAAVEHLLLSLIDDPDTAAVLVACNIDLEKLRYDLMAYIESELEKFTPTGSYDSQPMAGLQRVVERAAIYVQSSGREEVTGANALVAILAEHESQAAAALKEQGMTRYDTTLYISHGITKEHRLSRDQDDPGLLTVSDNPPGLLARVLLLNDDYTPMEFVMHVLERVFDKDREAATRIMLEIHNEGIGICGIYPCDTAGEKAKEVHGLAHEHQHPLQCVLE